MKPYSVLTLSKFPDHLDRCLSNIFVSQPDLSFNEIFVVDDGLPDRTKQRWKVNYIPGEKPFIFARNFNIGIQAVPVDKDVFFIGDDGVLLTANGIDILYNISLQMPTVGIISPAIAGPTKNLFQMQGVLNKIVKSSDLIGKPGYCPTIVFYAVYIKRAAIEAVGSLPEQLHAYGFEDDYFSSKMLQHHYDWAIVPHVVVKHGFGKFQSASSYQREGLDPIKLMEINRKIYNDLMKNENKE